MGPHFLGLSHTSRGVRGGEYKENVQFFKNKLRANLAISLN